MKYLIVSDIHGSISRLKRVIEHFEAWKIDILIILGDILNYGPRNGVPSDLNAPEIVSLLNKYADRVVAVRGNCDSEVDQMLLQFPMMNDYAMLIDNGIRMFLTHGHKYNENSQPVLGYDIMCYGHTHVMKLEADEAGRIVLNTGSITFPKNGNEPSFATYMDGILSLHDMEGNKIKQITIQKRT